MSAIILRRNADFREGEIHLPSSKSLSNRALIIRAVSSVDFPIHDLSESDDTKNLLSSLADLEKDINVGAAGTNMRFLISLLSISPGNYILTGNERMQKRPVGELVQALISLGADIQYRKNPGYPPLEIHGKELLGGQVSISGNISSQFISSLLMIAPNLKKGLEIIIKDGTVSRSYIDMTLGLMNYFGVSSKTSTNSIRIQSQKYRPQEYTVECDWSAAAFWYGMIANSKPGTTIFLKGLQRNSLQGDKKAMDYFKQLGVETKDHKNGLLIQKTPTTTHHISLDLLHEPDLFPVLAFTCAALRIPASFTGLQTLNLKESNRIDAVANELTKTGAICKTRADQFEITDYTSPSSKIVFDTHDDHRLAMAASVFSGSLEEITINHPEVVSKSYPDFWKDIKTLTIVNIY